MKLEDIKKLCDAATHGPWKHDWGNHDIEGPRRLEVVTKGEDPNYVANLEFIAASRILLPNLTRVAEAAKAVCNVTIDGLGNETKEQQISAIRLLHRELSLLEAQSDQESNGITNLR